MLLAPMAGEVLRDLVGGLAAAAVAMHREASRVPFTGDDVANDGHPGLTGEVGDRAMDLNVHLVQRLLHPLHAARTLRDEVRHLPLQRAESGDRLTWTKRAPEQAAAVEQLEPLAV